MTEPVAALALVGVEQEPDSRATSPRTPSTIAPELTIVVPTLNGAKMSAL